MICLFVNFILTWNKNKMKHQALKKWGNDNIIRNWKTIDDICIEYNLEYFVSFFSHLLPTLIIISQIKFLDHYKPNKIRVCFVRKVYFLGFYAVNASSKLCNSNKNVAIAVEKLQGFLGDMASGQWGILIMPHLLWHKATYCVLSSKQMFQFDHPLWQVRGNVELLTRMDPITGLISLNLLSTK